MKKVYSIVFFGLMVFGFSNVLHAQTGFDVKKHKKQNLNTSSLNAQHTTGANSNTSGRSVQKLLVPNSQKLTKQSIGKPQLKIHYSKETGLPAFIYSPRAANSGSRVGSVKDSRTATFQYLEEIKDALQIEKTDDAFAINSITVGRDNHSHVRMDERYRGIPVYGAEVIVHLNEAGEGESFNGRYFKINKDISVTPDISDRDAVQRVTLDLQRRSKFHELDEVEKKYVQYAEPKSTLCIYQDNSLVKTHVLAYHIISCPSLYERWEYFVDATTGTILHQFESTCGVDGPRISSGTDLNGVSRTVNTYQAGTTFYMLDASRSMFKAAGSTMPDDPIGGILTVDMNNTHGTTQKIRHVVSASSNSWTTATQKSALSAHFNAGQAFEYYFTKHGRNSIDGVGGTIISIVNVPDEDGNDLDNAYWNGKAMFYGNGNTEFKPLAGAMDVSGHELTHGVVQNTANLEYEGESGAINESMADVFGTMMDPGDWTLGEDIVKPGAFPSGALRSMADPHNGGAALGSPGYQPAHTSEKYTGIQDNGGVHVNSGIPNHAFYLFAQAITRDKAADVYYYALGNYLTKSSQFIDLRLAIIKAASDMYGAGSNEVTQAGVAFDAVGITNGQGSENNPTLPSNPGTEFMLLYNTDPSNPKTLYRAPVDNPNNAVPLTEVTLLSRPSITDEGDVAVFVGEDHNIYVIITKPGSTEPAKALTEDGIWSNVVVSKGGTKLAAVTTDEDATIYVYDFGTKEWHSFALYNPTYTEGVTSAGPVYADALEWDYTGQLLVYDCFNRIENADGSDIEYWDVNFLHVWDNDANAFGNGKIEKLFSSLPDGVSIGNPSFAKNSPNVIAFDYVDDNIDEGADDKYAILGCNVETNDLDAIAANNTIGWPSYNKSDQRVAFTTLGSAQDYDVSFVTLQVNKITGTSAASVIVDGAKWPVYFATGDRDTGDGSVTAIPDNTQHESLITCYPNPVQREVVIETGDPGLIGGKIEVLNAIGQRVYSSTAQVLDEKHIVVNLEHLQSGQYFMRISGGRKSAGCNLFKR
ncbi:MAG: M4 family metallopeptidase [Chryseolinea sp.]